MLGVGRGELVPELGGLWLRVFEGVPVGSGVLAGVPGIVGVGVSDLSGVNVLELVGVPVCVGVQDAVLDCEEVPDEVKDELAPDDLDAEAVAVLAGVTLEVGVPEVVGSDEYVGVPDGVKELDGVVVAVACGVGMNGSFAHGDPSEFTQGGSASEAHTPCDGVMDAIVNQELEISV